MKLLRGHTLPSSMKGLAYVDHGVELVERALPVPKHGQLLIHMRAAPINPNDLMFLDGIYEVKKPLGTIAGFEGTGTVVATGGGAIARFMLGRDVACAAGEGDGTWAEYACADALQSAPLKHGTDPQQAAMLLTNPLTASVLLATARRAGHRAFVQNAAAGAIGKMLVRSGARAGEPVIISVRRPAQAAAFARSAPSTSSSRANLEPMPRYVRCAISTRFASRSTRLPASRRASSPARSATADGSSSTACCRESRARSIPTCSCFGDSTSMASRCMRGRSRRRCSASCVR